MQILSSLVSPDGGEVRSPAADLAQEADAVRSAVGVTGQFSAVDNLLTGEENLLLMADLYHLDRRDEAGGARPSCWSSSSWSRRPPRRPPPSPAA